MTKTADDTRCVIWINHVQPSGRVVRQPRTAGDHISRDHFDCNGMVRYTDCSRCGKELG